MAGNRRLRLISFRTIQPIQTARVFYMLRSNFQRSFGPHPQDHELRAALSPEPPGSKFKSRRTMLIMMQTSNDFPDLQTTHLTSSPLSLCDRSQLPSCPPSYSLKRGRNISPTTLFIFFFHFTDSYSIEAGWGRKCSQKQSSTRRVHYCGEGKGGSARRASRARGQELPSAFRSPAPPTQVLQESVQPFITED